MRELAWINGKVVELNEACVPLEDRGFLFGDGVYEACRIYNGVPFFLAEHLRRLADSAAAIMLDLPHTPPELAALIGRFIEDCGCMEGYLYLQLTRGASPRAHEFPGDTPPTLVMYVRALPPGLDWRDPAGVPCITLPDERWLHCNIKSVNLLPNVMAKEKAKRAGAFEAVFYRPGGLVTEGTRSNIFAVIDGVASTHPESNLILPGITRRVVLDILDQSAIPRAEKPFTLAELGGAAEAWLSSSVAEITPVITLDGKPVGNGEPGPVVRRIIEEYRELVRRHCRIC